jgi:hypothetical protein
MVTGAKCGCKIPKNSTLALNFLVHRLIENQERCFNCDRHNLQQKYFLRGVRHVEAEELERWRDELSEAD